MGDTAGASAQGAVQQQMTIDEKNDQITAQAAEVFGRPKAEDPIASTGKFTAEEQAQIRDYAETIDIRDTSTIIEYGSGVQKKMADFSESILQNVKTHDLGEVGTMLTGVISDLKDFNPGAQKEEKGGLFGLFKKPAKKISEMKSEYDKAADNIDKVAASLQRHQITLLKDVDMLDQMYEQNLAYYKNLSMYIAAGKTKIRQAREVDLPAMKAKAAASGLAEDAEAAKDFEDQITRFEKKIYDLELTRTVALQTAPQIRMIQNNDTVMVEKIQSTIVNTIPLWKNQMVLALGLEDSNQAAKAQSEVTDMTNQLLMSNAEKLKMTTIETAKASERGIVDMETLKKTNESLIATLDEVSRIQTEGRQKRAQAETDLRNLEESLKFKLLNMQPEIPAVQEEPAVPEIPEVPAAPKLDPSDVKAPWES
ncbi:MAG: toxic anion resistance protein [Lachnospiraceae bacterium]|nr:toxic anion resistance protein [Lachnospiraceae bacterium]